MSPLNTSTSMEALPLPSRNVCRRRPACSEAGSAKLAEKSPIEAEARIMTLAFSGMAMVKSPLWVPK